MEKRKMGIILALSAAAVSGVAVPVNKIFVVNIDPLVFTALRAIIIGIIFLSLSFAFEKRKKKIDKKTDWRYMAAIAVIGGAVAFALYFSGLKMTTAGHAAFLHKTLPLYVAVLAFIFLNEKLTKKYFFAMGLMIIGTIAIYFSQISPAELWSNPQMGDLLVISATFLWAVENVIAKKAMNNGETNFIVSFSRMFFGGLILFGAIIAMGRTDALLSLTHQNLANIMISTALLFCYVLFYYWAIRLIDVSKASAFLLIAPVISLFIGNLALGEPVLLLQIAGSVAILAGAYIMIEKRIIQEAV